MSSTTLAGESQQLALELYQILTDLDPANWRARVAASARERLEDIQRRVKALLEKRQDDPEAALRTGLSALVDVLSVDLPSLPTDDDDAPAELTDRWMAFRKRIQPAYEALALALKAEAVHVPSLRPTNHARKVFHVFSAVVVMSIIALLPFPMWLSIASGTFTIAAWGVELLRRVKPEMNAPVMRLFGPIAHPYEHYRVNSATWYTTALFLISLTQSPMLCFVAVAMLGFGDPAAAVIGRRWGRVKLVNGRSLEGTLAFIAAGGTLTWLALRLGFPLIALSHSLTIVGAATLMGALAELFSRRVDDNLSIPVASVLGGLIAMSVLGI